MQDDHFCFFSQVLSDGDILNHPITFYRSRIEMGTGMQRGIRLAGESYQRLMTSYLSLDRKAEAIAACNRCQKILQSGLGIDPYFRAEEFFKGIKEMTYLLDAPRAET
jgi:hypothetical protein